MDEVNKIIEKSLATFLRYGIKSVTMDDISREIGISKKTLYQYFENKKDLVNKCMHFHINLECTAVENIRKNDVNPIDELFDVCNFFSTMMREMNPSLMLDLQKYHPDSWELLQEHKHSFAYENILENIKNGREIGIYREDFDETVVAKLYISRLETMMDQKLFPFSKYPLKHVITEMISYHIRGIATDKGLKYLEKKKKKLQNNEP